MLDFIQNRVQLLKVIFFLMHSFIVIKYSCFLQKQALLLKICLMPKRKWKWFHSRKVHFGLFEQDTRDGVIFNRIIWLLLLLLFMFIDAVVRERRLVTAQGWFLPVWTFLLSFMTEANSCISIQRLSLLLIIYTDLKKKILMSVPGDKTETKKKVTSLLKTKGWFNFASECYRS